MLKNTYLIKENYKKIEEVREIESEIPTYEEFLKDYQVDQGVSESYESEVESYSRIGTSKGFGPCYYPNFNCSCYVSQGFMSLYMSCPSCSNADICVWTHSNARLATSNQSSSCRGNLLVSEYFHIKCSDCNEEGHWGEWMFSCSHHDGYKYVPSSMAFIDASKTGLRIQVSNPALRDLVKRISTRLINENR